jgi:PAS domain S-box-containing protein
MESSRLSDLDAELFDQLLQIMPQDLIWVFSAEWDEVIFLSDGYEELWGRSRGSLETNPRDFLNGIHPTDRETVTDAMERMSAGESVDIEFRIVPDEGSYRWIAAHGAPIRDETGSVVRVAGLVRDITQRTERERDLGRYRTIIKTVPDGVYIFDADFRVSFVNDALLEITGYDREELLGSHASRILDEDALKTAEQIRDQLKSGHDEFGTLQTAVKTASGGRVPCEIHGQLLGGSGGARGTTGIIRDITERKERERELRARSTAMETSIDGMAILDEHGEYVFVNQAHAGIYGYDGPEAFLGETWRMCYEGDEIERFAEEVMPTLFDEGSWRGEAVGTRKNGSTFPQELSLTVADDGRIVCVVRDITERKQQERELERQNERLEAFAETVSHDLRNPLSVATGQLELAQDEHDSEHLDGVDNALDRVDTLIDDLLTLAQEGESVSDMQPVSLTDIAGQCWRTVETAEATLVTETERGINADRSRLQELLENLMRNSVEHGGKSVTVAVGDLSDGFYVADDGPGIAEAERDEVFKSGYSTATDGTGFGLNIVQEIADAHGWDVQITESESGGARFEFRGVTTSRADT